jgi:hypothetical protein
MARGWVWAQRIGLILLGVILGWLIGTQTQALSMDFGDLGSLKTSTLGVGFVGLGAGILGATAGRLLWRTFWASRERPGYASLPNSTLAGFTFVGFAVLVALVDAGVRQGLIKPDRGALGLALALLMLLFGVVALSALQRGETVEVEGHWGGLGGALGGWRLSPSAVLILFVALFAVGAVSMLLPRATAEPKHAASASVVAHKG